MIRYALALVSLCLWPAAAFAQEDRGAIVGAIAAATNMEERTDFAFAGTFGYRFSRVFGLEIEATAVPDLRTSFDDGVPVILNGSSLTGSSFTATATGATGGASSLVQIFPPPTFANQGGRVVIFTNNARVEIPTISTRVTPYFVAGGGIANVRRTADFTYLVPILNTVSPSVIAPPLRPISQPIASSATELALTIGGGVDVRVMKRLAIEADLRLFRLLGQDDQNLGRFGVGVRYRF